LLFLQFSLLPFDNAQVDECNYQTCDESDKEDVFQQETPVQIASMWIRLYDANTSMRAV
jgi:hypothetical protein